MVAPPSIITGPGPSEIPGMDLQHLAYKCPVRKWHVQPMTMRELLSNCGHLRIPLFQRRYCWEMESQIAGWWRDLLQSSGDAYTGHRVGRMYFTRGDGDDPESLLVIDGQQRLTTTFLFLASLRDVLLAHLHSADNSKSHTQDSNSNSNNTGAMVELLSEIERILYCVNSHHNVAANTTSAEAAILHSAAVQRAISAQCEPYLHTDEVLGELHYALPAGETLPLCRLTPSYQDRAPFYQLLTVGRLQYRTGASAHAENNARAENDARADNDARAGAKKARNIALSLDAHSHALVRTKATFDACVQSYLAHVAKGVVAATNPNGEELHHTTPIVSTGDHASDAASNHDADRCGHSAPITDQRNIAVTKAVRYLFSRSLDFFTLMYLECPNDVDLQQLFLWLQEKTLFGAGSLLWNPSPGVKFSACDLVRNFIMSYVSARTQEEQKEFYNTLWVPLETKFADAAQFDAFLHRFTLEKGAQARAEGRGLHVSEFEKTVQEITEMIGHGSSSESKVARKKLEETGAMQYARLYSYFERKSWEPQYRADPQSFPVALLAELTEFYGRLSA